MTAYSLILAADAARANVAWTLPGNMTPPIGGGTSAGWTTALDIDLTAQGNIPMPSDGPYTIAGLTWTKSFTSQERSAMGIVPGAGNGLIIAPAHTALWNSGGVHQAPMLQLQLTTIPALSTLDWTSALRIWTYYPTITTAGVGDASIAALSFFENVPTAHLAANDYVGYYGQDNSGNIGSAAGFCQTNNSFRSNTTAFALGSYVVNVLEAACNVDLIRNYYASSSGNAWPSAQALNLGNSISYDSGGYNRGTLNLSWPGPQGPLSDMCLTLAAQATSATMLSTLSRVRIDVRL